MVNSVQNVANVAHILLLNLICAKLAVSLAIILKLSTVSVSYVKMVADTICILVGKNYPW